MARRTDAVLRELAERQHGVVGRAQARAAGASREALRNRVAAGSWVALTPRVLRLAGRPPSFAQRCMVAALDAGQGAVISHTTAACLWELPGFGPGPVHVSRLRAMSGRPTAVATLHQPRYLPANHLTVSDGIPVTSVARTLFDLSGCLHPLRSERALDNALSRKLVGLEVMRAVAIELLEHGRSGSALMRQLLSDRGAGYIPPASGLEARALALLVEAGLELPDRQVDVGGECWVGRVDYLFRSCPLVLEIDSDRHHTSKLDAEADARRDEALRAAGYRILRITEHQLWNRPHEVVALVRAALSPVLAPETRGNRPVPGARTDVEALR